MVSEMPNRTATATVKYPAFDWPARNRPTQEAKAFFAKDFWAVAGCGVLALMISLGLAYATLASGIDLTVGAVPIDMPVQMPPLGN